MDMRKVALDVACISLLSGCMTGGVGRAGRFDRGGSGSLQYAEATTGDLTIALSFPTPSIRSEVAIEARLTAANGPHELIDGDVWLSIQTPGGNIDEVRMQRLHGSAEAVYGAAYNFWSPGSYLVTARGRLEEEAGAHEASVTTRAVVDGGPYAVDHGDWMMPMAVLGGLGMVVMMVVMMGS
jgi:hypothetical protein